jgi:TPR repeat protein
LQNLYLKRNSYNLKQKNYNSSSIFLLGFFNFYGIETSKDNEKVINLFINASEKDFILAQYFIGLYNQSE